MNIPEPIHHWKVGDSSFQAAPEKGARLLQWKLTELDGREREIVYWPKVDSLNDIASIRGGNPILFPFCGRSYDSGEIHFWRANDGVRRPMPMHGIAQQGRFRIIRLDATGFSAEFEPDAEARASYPFDYRFTVSYRFAPRGLVVELELTNLGTSPIPWSAGHHFYFTLPWRAGQTRRDYVLETTSTKRFFRDELGGLTPAPTTSNRMPFVDPLMVDLIQTGMKGEEFKVADTSSEDRLLFRASMANCNPHDFAIVSWTKDEQTPYYCVEPWMGPPSAVVSGVGLHWVEPGKTQVFRVDINVP